MNGTLAIKLGDRLNGLTITVANNAAMLNGRVVAEREGERLPPGLRVHLVPVESEQAENAIHYAEVPVRNGRFEFGNIPPGRYWILAHPVSNEEAGKLPIAWNSNGRAVLRREAAAANRVIELQPCSRVADQVVRFKN